MLSGIRWLGLYGYIGDVAFSGGSLDVRVRDRGAAWLMKVLVADEHLAVRAGLRAILGTETDMEVVGEATEGGQAIALTEQLQPDIVLLDVFMVPMGGIEACRAIKAQWPAIKVLVMSELAQLSIVRRALEAGANGYLVKNASKGLIIQSVRAIYAGGLVLPQDIGRRLLMDHSSYLN